MSDRLRKSLTFSERFSEPQSVVSFLFLYCALNFLVRAVGDTQFHAGRIRADAVQPDAPMELSAGTAAPDHVAQLGFARRQRRQPYSVSSAQICAHGAWPGRLFRCRAHRHPGHALCGLGGFALCATISMGYLPLIDKPQIVLLSTMLATYMWADARVLTRGTWLDHLILGIVTGLGILSGYIFLVMPLGARDRRGVDASIARASQAVAAVTGRSSSRSRSSRRMRLTLAMPVSCPVRSAGCGTWVQSFLRW